MVVSQYSPSTTESLDQIGDLRAAAHAVEGADALVGGAVATDVDARAGNSADLWLIAPLVLAVCFVVLVVLLRSLVAPTLLLLVNLGSAVVSLIDADDSVRLDVMDDGVGFDPSTLDQRRAASPSGSGLRYMRDRLRELGGGLDIESVPGESTAISGHLPIRDGSGARR